MTRVDAPPVEDAAEARVLLLHHLRLAAMYFEATDEDIAATFPADEFSLKAMFAWVAAMDALYSDD